MLPRLTGADASRVQAQHPVCPEGTYSLVPWLLLEFSGLPGHRQDEQGPYSAGLMQCWRRQDKERKTLHTGERETDDGGGTRAAPLEDNTELGLHDEEEPRRAPGEKVFQGRVMTQTNLEPEAHERQVGVCSQSKARDRGQLPRGLLELTKEPRSHWGALGRALLRLFQKPTLTF